MLYEARYLFNIIAGEEMNEAIVKSLKHHPASMYTKTINCAHIHKTDVSQTVVAKMNSPCEHYIPSFPKYLEWIFNNPVSTPRHVIFYISLLF